MVCEAAKVLEIELQTYEAHRGDLLHLVGKWVLIHGDKVAGTFDREQDALRAGYSSFGNVPFLVKQVTSVEVAKTVVSAHLAL
jgi:hypothetical protein